MKNAPHITILFLATLLLFLTSSSCKDKNKKTYCEENPSECSNIQGVKDYFCFKEGSWWVYQEETTLERDSVYITQYYNDLSNYDFDVRMYSTHQDYFYHFFPLYAGGSQNCNPSGNIYSTCIRIKRAKYKSGDFVDEATCFLFKFKLGSFSYVPNNYFENNRITVSNLFDNYNCGLSTFNKVVQISELNTLMEGKQPTNHFFAQGVGLIRKELIDSNQVWNLVSYHIEP
jgi:hypothetical protein